MSAGDWKDMLSAVQMGRISVVKYHIDQGIDLNYQHPELMTTPLIEAVIHEEVQIVKLLLENGADPKLRAGYDGESPMAVAKSVRNPEIIGALRACLSSRDHSTLAYIKHALLPRLCRMIRR